MDGSLVVLGAILAFGTVGDEIYPTLRKVEF
jgi:hypothetical protein